MPRLVHHVEPELAGFVEFEADRLPTGAPGLNSLTGYSVSCKRLRIEFRNEELAEIRVPNIAVLIDDDVMRLDFADAASNIR